MKRPSKSELEKGNALITNTVYRTPRYPWNIHRGFLEFSKLKYAYRRWPYAWNDPHSPRRSQSELFRTHHSSRTVYFHRLMNLKNEIIIIHHIEDCIFATLYDEIPCTSTTYFSKQIMSRILKAWDIGFGSNGHFNSLSRMHEKIKLSATWSLLVSVLWFSCSEKIAVSSTNVAIGCYFEPDYRLYKTGTVRNQARCFAVLLQQFGFSISATYGQLGHQVGD